MKLKIMAIIPSGLIIGMAIILLYVLINIAIYGKVVISEPNSVILGAETILMFSIIILGICLAVKEINKED